MLLEGLVVIISPLIWGASDDTFRSSVNATIIIAAIGHAGFGFFFLARGRGIQMYRWLIIIHFAAVFWNAICWYLWDHLSYKIGGRDVTDYIAGLSPLWVFVAVDMIRLLMNAHEQCLLLIRNIPPSDRASPAVPSRSSDSPSASLLGDSEHSEDSEAKRR